MATAFRERAMSLIHIAELSSDDRYPREIPVNPQEERIAVLEAQLHELLQWKKNVAATFLSLAFSANIDFQALKASAEPAKLTSPLATRFPSGPRQSGSISANKPHRKPERKERATTKTSQSQPTQLEQKPVFREPFVEKTKEKQESKPKEKVEKPQETIQQKPQETTPQKLQGEPQANLAPEETPSVRLAARILDVIQSYGRHLATEKTASDSANWIGRSKFLPRVIAQVEAGRPITMILPSFPWKSINRVDKVTGALPDLGEELSLARLNSLCVDISAIYEHGAELNIATDGLVFNDIVGISDDDTWDYSVALMNMAAERGYHGIKMVRVMDLLGKTEGREVTKELYLSLVDECRKELEAQFGNPDKDIREMIKNDPDTLMTYRGFIRFLETDLKHSAIAKNATSGQQFRKKVKEVAMGMMTRAEAFTKIIQAKRPDVVRLSIHPSTGAEKLTVPLIPQKTGSFPKTPWHCSIAVGVDGSYSTVHSKDVRDTHSLIYQHGRPYFYREKSELYDWGVDKVEFEHQYLGGVIVRPRADLQGVEADLVKLRQLAAHQSVVLQGFANAPDGELLPN